MGDVCEGVRVRVREMRVWSWWVSRRGELENSARRDPSGWSAWSSCTNHAPCHTSYSARLSPPRGVATHLTRAPSATASCSGAAHGQTGTSERAAPPAATRCRCAAQPSCLFSAGRSSWLSSQCCRCHCRTQDAQRARRAQGGARGVADLPVGLPAALGRVKAGAAGATPRHRPDARPGPPSCSPVPNGRASQPDALPPARGAGCAGRAHAAARGVAVAEVRRWQRRRARPRGAARTLRGVGVQVVRL